MAQYHVNLSFSADASKAKAQLKDLQNQLTNLINTPQSKLGIEGEINSAIKAAAELKAHLQAATNVKTGNLDFSKLSQSLKQSNTTLTQYATKLQQLGPAGQQAFMTLAQSVAQAEIPIRRSSAALDKMWETLKNTARWQVSSTVLHGFMGAVQSAYGYAQDLNKSLNDIRIVTGQNTDQMAKFAKEANKAAKALSTSTTNYTKASLIYYQQGLNDQEVKDRTDITVKMANVARSSAQDVSDQLTAVWNNFYDGSKSLEHYADVMTALGAATASSTDEISEGLNKFAAVAETVGLSYEYAASALATVTATTRESADIVGNAFKTLFARIQGLKLGETLDDGTTLNKYSQALDAVGIKIKSANGEMKDMDAILNELGAKWDTLGKDQQIALAQTVAGVRQYTQLIALMDNWDYFQENLGVANNSTGTLQEQAEIYAESWEAASKRVEAAAQSIYEKLMNDDFFIDLLNSLEKVLNFTDNLIDSMGGLKGVLMTLSTVATKLFADKMAQGLSTMAYNIKMSTKSGREAIQNEQKQFIDQAVNEIPKNVNYTTETEKAQMANLRNQLELQSELITNSSKMSQIELSTNQALLDRTKILQEQYETAAKARDAADAAVSEATDALRANFAQSAYGDEDAYKQLTQEAASRIASLQTTANAEYDINAVSKAALEQLATNGSDATKVMQQLKTELQQIGQESEDDDIKQCIVDFIAIADSGADAEFAVQELKRQLIALKNTDIKELKLIVTDNPEQIDELSRRIDAQIAAQKRQTKAEQSASEERKKTGQSIKNATGAQKTWADTLVASANAIAGFSSALSMMGGIWDTLQDPDLSGWEKFTTIMTTLGILIPTLVTAWTSLKAIISSETLVKIANAAATWGQVVAEQALNKTKGQGVQITKGSIKQTVSDTKDKVVSGAKNTWGKIKSIPENWNNMAFNSISKDQRAAYRQQYATEQGLKWDKSKMSYMDASGNKVSMKSVNSGASKLAGQAAGKGLATFGLAAVAAVAAVAAGAAMVKAAQNAYHKAEIEASRAKQAADKLSEAFNKANGEYTNLVNSMSAYSDAKAGLNELAKGTVEYAEAISTANDEALNLIHTYDELAGQYQVNADGLIEINEAALENVRLMKLQERNSAQAKALSASQRARDLQIESDKVNLARHTLTGDTSEYTVEDQRAVGTGAGIGVGIAGVGGAIAGVKIGTSLGAFAGPVGAAIGAAAGLVIGGIVGGIVATIDKKEATTEEKKAIDALYEAYEEQGEGALTPEGIQKALTAKGITDPDLIASLVENKDEVSKLVKEMSANTAATLAENTLLAAQLHQQSNPNYDNYSDSLAGAMSKVSGQIATNAGGTFDEEYDVKDYRKGRWYTLGIAKKATDEGEKAFKAWAEAQGYTDAEATNFSGDVVKYKRYDAEKNKYVKEEVTYDEIAAIQRASRVENATTDTLAAVNNLVMSLSANDKTGGILDIINTETLNSLTGAEFTAFKQAFENGEFAKDLAELGRLTGTDYAKQVASAIEDWDYDIALKNYAKNTQDEIDSLFAETSKETEYDTKALENYAQALTNSTSALSAWSDGWEKADKQLLAAKASIANAKLVKGVEALSTAVAENITLLEAWDSSLATYQAAAEVQNALETMFGTSVSADFVKNNLNQIKSLASGETDYLNELRAKAAKDYVSSLDLNASDEEFIIYTIDTLKKQIENGEIELGGSISNSLLTSLNAVLASGEMTKEELETIFGSLGFEVDVGTYTNDDDEIIAYIKGENTANAAKDMESGDSAQYLGADIDNLLSGIDLDFGNKKELDRYHYISKTLEDVERQYDAIADARERAFGADKLALYQKEIDKAKEVRDVLQRYADEAFEYYDKDQKALLNEPYGIILDENGNISNYDEVFANFGQDEKFQELVSNYEDSLTTWKEKLQEVIDKNNELLDLSLEKIQYKIDLAVKIDDQNQEYFDFLMEMADDPLTNAAEKLGYLTDKMNSSTKVAEQMGKSLREALQATGWSDGDINSILAGANIEELLASNKLTETQIEMIEQYRDQLYTTTQMLMTWADDIKDTVIEAFDEMGKTYDESASKLEHYNKILTTYENIIDLVGRDTLGISDSVFGELTQVQVDNAVSMLRVHKEAYETDKAALQQLRDSYDESWSDDAKEAWNEAIKHAEEKVRESEATMFDSWESALQAAADAFEKAVETAVKAYEKAMSGIHGSFDAMQTAYERQTTLNERYLEDYEKIYELSKLNRQIANSVDDTDNVKSKKILKELQDEILELSESEAEVSEYQIGHLQKEYELKMALIALEEAQNAKSQVRMQRDSEGNWSYVYTADEAKVDDAQQNYEDKLFALQEYTQEYIQTNSDALMQLQQEYADAMANIKRENYATQEEYEAALAETTAFYEQMMNYHLDKIGLATTNAQELYEKDWAKYSEMTGYKLSIDKQWIDSWKETPVALTTGLDSITKYQDAFKDSSENMIIALSNAYGTWRDNVNTAMDAAGTATDEFAGKVETDTETIQGYSEKLVSYLDDIGEAAREAFKEVVDTAAKNYADYSDTVADYIARNKELIASLNEVIKKKAEVENQNTTNVTGNNTGNLSGQGNSPSTDDTDNKHGDDFYSIKADAMNRDGSVDKVVNMNFTADELKTLKRANDGWGAYTVMKNGVEYQLHSDSVRYAMAQAGFYELYKDRNEFTRNEQSSITEKTPQNATDAIGKPVSIPASNKYRQFAFFTDAGKHEYTQTLEGEGIVQEVKQMTNEYGKTAWYYKLSNSNGRWIMASSFAGPLDPSKFDTGGYTGSWGSDGRLALLHQKELVLNADDTRNMLQAVEIVRKIVRVIDLNAANAANAFGMLTATTAATNDQVIEQEVTIHAEFPNATNHTEIEEAFNTLINQASQFANRKK